MKSKTMNLTCLLLTIALALVSVQATAQMKPSSDLLVPFFEVDLTPPGVTTLFAVGNSTEKPVDLLATVHTNWGIAILKVPMTLQPREVRTVNLRDWFNNAGDPKKAAATVELLHLAAATTGKASPKDHLYYGSEVRPELAVGYVTLRTQGDRPDALWGDWFLVDVNENYARGDVLVNIDSSSGCPGLCKRHLLRYLNGGGFDGGTEVIIWREVSAQPSSNPNSTLRLRVDATAYNEPGQPIDNRVLELLPVEKVKVSELGLKEPFGALDIESEGETFIGVQHSASGRYSVGLMSYCLELEKSIGPGIKIRKLTNGQHATQAPGPSIPVGATVTWEYVVSNVGDTPLTDIVVTDDQGVAVTCPKESLASGESMTCTGTGKAEACAYTNLGTVRAQTPDGNEVTHSDRSHYFGDEGGALALAITLNGQPASSSPGPKLEVGSDLNWSYKVTNTGLVKLIGVKVSDDRGTAVTCPKSTLQPDESMTCTGKGKAAEGLQKAIVTAAGDGSCSGASGKGDGYYTGESQPPEIKIIKLTNGQDANLPPGPSIPAGSAVTWQYQVTNTGKVALSDVKVTDDKGVAVSCPKTTLKAGESMTCTGQGVAQACQYENLGTVTGKAPNGTILTDSDPSHYFGSGTAEINIETSVNGQDADVPKGPEVAAGSALSFASVVKNTGTLALAGIQVTDSKGLALSCPATSLQPGASMTCTASGVAQEGQFSSVGTASGVAACGQPASDTDPINYWGTPLKPGLKIVKRTNGEDANAMPGPSIPVGSTVTWTYEVTNTGEVALSNLKVTDDKGVAVSCPKTTLQPGESMTCTGSGKAQACQYENLGTVTGKAPNGESQTASDPSHYYGVTHPAIQIETAVNGNDADSPKGPEFPVGSSLSFTYVVKNTGDVALTNVKVTDSKGVAVSCPKTTLQPGESMTCTASGKATEGQYTAIGTATGKGSCDQSVSDDDPVNYWGQTINTGEGCTPGYWKNHEDSWQVYSTSQKVQSVFGQASLYPTLGNATLLQALYFEGGSDLTGAAGNLLRAATASLLNSAHNNVDFPWVTSQVIHDVNGALASKNRDTIISLASVLDKDNNLGCPLN